MWVLNTNPQQIKKNESTYDFILCEIILNSSDLMTDKRSMLVTSRLLGGLSNCLVVFPFHDRFWTLLLSFLQEACPRCCDLNGVR